MRSITRYTRPAGAPRWRDHDGGSPAPRRRGRRTTAVLAAALIAAHAACFGSRQKDGDSGPAPNNELIVAVQNNNWSDVTIYVLQGGRRVRLGTIAANARAVLTLQGAFGGAGSFRLLLDPIGRNAYLTDPIALRPGDVLDLVIENNLRLSSWSVR
jgi:hypothetical protein